MEKSNALEGGTSAHPENVLADFPAMETPDWVSGAWRSL